MKAPVYVAGLDLGVLPIGAWLISTILSIYFIPLISLYLPVCKCFLLFISFSIIGRSVSIISDDFPLPETPVTHTKVPNGIFKSIFFRLFVDAPLSSKYSFFLFVLLSVGVGILFLPDR